MRATAVVAGCCALLVFSGACREREHRQATAVAVGRTGSDRAASDTDAVARAVTLSDTTANDCDFRPRNAHRGPGELVREFVEWERSGRIFETGPDDHEWVFTAVECVAQIQQPVWRSTAVVESSRVDSIAVGRDTARYRVTFHVLGDVRPEDTTAVLGGDSALALRGGERDDVVSLTVVRTMFGWRLADIPSRAYLSPDATRRLLRDSARRKRFDITWTGGQTPAAAVVMPSARSS